ncbi:MAG: hypothetical protein HON47_00905 [Candidatus Diapherotrites archaeon]|jgi:hypothetical protein|uniref:Uncharacterized protein n=1 Tax=Candidatus Iainarchaeum sp. TaxID=3101447 RepID=A0A8T5GDS6_9ARCH|nr:hypothetical protein [Candidatus Diapherotrites archaeon]MBT7240939.1 hypothetical protein [Candidatus Diapherotrites archaeon]
MVDFLKRKEIKVALTKTSKIKGKKIRHRAQKAKVLLQSHKSRKPTHHKKVVIKKAN